MLKKGIICMNFTNLNKALVGLVFLCVVFGLARFFVPTTHDFSFTNVYKAFAHLLFGGLVGAALVSKDALYWFLAGALLVVELVAFFPTAVKMIS